MTSVCEFATDTLQATAMWFLSREFQGDKSDTGYQHELKEKSLGDGFRSYTVTVKTRDIASLD